ncbi:MAG: hypothetical protein HYX42_03180 [Polaromonas sp.]|uniref:hypothetical protein n=1 Tax=Polaromonas sp. TaxID=1869339 RepID=UPI0025D42E20|nr:hypothetical protein [Polaromonas sp.]MBI2725233.1 hypothetical protein [Polaromonas sp.]
MADMIRMEAVYELKRVFTVLNEDLDAALMAGREEPNQFAHRTLIRTYFAFVEGIAYQLRQVTRASLEGTDKLTQGEMALLREERFQLNARGEPEAKDNYQSMLPNLLFSVRCYVKNHGATYVPDTSKSGWWSMKQAVAIRDRITHPKSAMGLEISDEDANHFVLAAGWWKETLMEMFKACGEADVVFKSQQ